ncbi:MAG: LDL receptor domain-containing protein [Sandaracinaceae bacterium]|nr:LDL receptor domain-containing protein [Sandaracinaceae bacterium]
MLRALAHAVLLCLAGGCHGSLADRLDDCGLATEGVHGPRLTRSFYAPSDCYERCLASASCEALTDTVCGRSIALRLECDERCAYRCRDGALVGLERVCNGFSDCADGEDEAGCATTRMPGVFRCGDGSVISEWSACNGTRDCADGSDELGCFEHACRSGSVIRSARPARCDGNWQCDDGSDEDGCAELSSRCE